MNMTYGTIKNKPEYAFVRIRHEREDKYHVVAWFYDKEGLQHDYWFTVGVYKTIENAKKQAIRKMAKFNLTLEFVEA